VFVDPLTRIPATITSGDSVAVTLTRPDYPATAGWSLTWALAGPSVVTVASVAAGAAHTLTLTATQTAVLSAGAYRWSLRAVNGSTSATIEVGRLTVEADLATLAAGETLDWAEKTLTIAKAALAGTLEGEMKMYMIAGRQVMTFSPDELMRLISQLEARVGAIQTGTFGTPILFNVVGMR
jgi:hypothetical protein